MLDASQMESVKEDVTGGWRKCYNKDLHNLYSSPNIKEHERMKF
jgi:hypothetical protein